MIFRRTAPPPKESEWMPSPLAVVVKRVRLRAKLRTEWLRTLWRNETGAFEPSDVAVSHAEIDRILDERDTPEAERTWRSAREATVDAHFLALVEKEIAADDSSRLAHLCRIFVLGPQERDLLHCCVAAALDPALLRVFAYLQDHSGRACVTEALVGRLFGHGMMVFFDAEAPLLRWGLVNWGEAGLGEPRRYALDPAVRNWLLGSDALDEDLHGIARMQPAMPALPEWPVERTVTRLRRWLEAQPPTPVRVQVVGASRSGRKSFAALVAFKKGLPLLAVDVASVPEEDWPRIYVKAQRRAFLAGSALAFSGDAYHSRRHPDAIAHFPLEFLIGETARSTPSDGRSAEYLVELPPLTLDSRRQLWRHHAPWSATWPQNEFDLLIAQHRALPGDFERIGRSGAASPAETAAILREASRESLGQLAQRLDCSFVRDDLSLPPQLNAALDDLLFEAAERIAFWERPEALRLFPQGRGLLALFAGPPGTGKTMSAQVIAATLGVDLFRVDLAAIVSKWVGETSKNLDRMLARAAQCDVILLFDEADALFGRRTEIKEANDRFANTDTSYLLQAIENYRGIALLSTNRKADIDPAFLRRLRYVLDFPLPDEHNRRRILHRVVGELTGADRARTLAADLDALGSAVEASGAQLKFGILSAIFASRRESRPLTIAHLLRGIERELAKEGRPLSERVRERFGSDAG